MKVKLNPLVNGRHEIFVNGETVAFEKDQVIEVDSNDPEVLHHLTTNNVFISEPAATYVPLLIQVKDALEDVPTSKLTPEPDNGNEPAPLES
jgi:hypothetical protein